MADIFISYARADRAKIEKLASALKAEGFSVWWDRDLTGGEEFSSEIERELAAAKSVVVAWSKNGAASPWVRDEASMARQQQKLFPICLDDEKPPIGFRQFHSFDFSDWDGVVDADMFRDLLSSLKRRTGLDAAHPATTQLSTKAEKTRQPAWLIPAGILGSIMVALLAFVLLLSGNNNVPELERIGSGNDSGIDTVATDEETTVPVISVGLGVIPFVNMSSDPEQEYFADGLTEEMLNWLAQVEGLRVPGRTASFQFKSEAGDFARIGEALGVEYLLEGSVRRSGDTIRITAQLIEAQTGYHLWSEAYDRRFDDIFRIQDEVAQRVVTELLGQIPEQGMKNPAAIGDVDPHAHELYLQGRALYAVRRNAEAFEKFREAVAVDPAHWLAQAYLAIVGAHAASHGEIAGAVADKIIDNALQRAVVGAPNSADVLFAQGIVREHRAGEAAASDPEIEALFARAVRANPRHTDALHALANKTQDPDARMKLYQRIIDIEPGHHSANTNLANDYKLLGEPERALATMRAYLGVRPDETTVMYNDLLKNIGDWQASFESSLRLIGRENATPYDLYNAAISLADLGAVEEAATLTRYAAKKWDGTPLGRWLASRASVLENDFERAVGDLASLDDAANKTSWVTFNYARALLHAGRPQESLDVIMDARPGVLRASGEGFTLGFAEAIVDLEAHAAALALRQLDRDEEAQELWLALRPHIDSPIVSGWPRHLGRAMIFAQTDEPDRAFEELDLAYDAGFRFLWSFTCNVCVEPGFFAETGVFGPLMDDPRFAAYVEKIERENTAYLAAVSEKIGVREMLDTLYAGDREGRD